MYINFHLDEDDEAKEVPKKYIFDWELPNEMEDLQ